MGKNNFIKELEEIVMSTEREETFENEREKTLNALKESELRYQKLRESFPLPTFEINSEGMIIYANKKALQLTGYTPSDIESELNMMQVIHPEDHELLLKMSQKSLKGHIVVGNEYRFVTKDGDTIQTFVNTERVIHPDGTVGLQGYIFDLTERKQAEEALRESEEKYQALFDFNPIEAMVVDENLKIVAYNQAKSKSGKRLPKIGVDIMYETYAAEHENPSMKEELKMSIKSGIPKDMLGKVYNESNGKQTIYDICFAPLPKGGGATITSQNITERKQQERFQQALAEIPKLVQENKDPYEAISKVLGFKVSEVKK